MNLEISDVQSQNIKANMGLSNIFKKKTDQSSNTNLSLEELLQHSANEPAYRAEFYKRLLTDNLIVITQNSGLQEGNHTLQQDTNVNIVSYEDGRIPVFTTTDRIFDKGVIKEQVNYLQLKGEDLFTITKGATLILNPYSDYGKEFLPNEIESMLNGTMMTSNHREIVVEKETQVLIAQPSVYPTEMINSLKIMFAAKQNVKAAYLGWIHYPESGDPPHYVIGLDMNGDMNAVIQESGLIAKQFLKENDIIDFMQMDNSEGVISYLKSTEPFFKR